ncbi:MAG: putative Ig domain-containing protein [Sulfurovum sp.]|nr:putative Ig domain-containing protein [Sulfurovum sp.]
MTTTTPQVGDTVEFTITTTNKGFDKTIRMQDYFPLTSGTTTAKTTRDAFELISYTKPADVTCYQSTWKGDPALTCYTNGSYRHDQSFTVTITAKVTKRGEICNLASSTIIDSWSWMGSDTICMNATGIYAPVLDIPDFSRVLFSSLSINLSDHTTDLDGDTSFSYGNISGLPPGLSMDAAGHISGTLTEDTSATYPKEYTVTVTVTDSDGLTGNGTFKITVTIPEFKATDNNYSEDAGNEIKGNFIVDDTGDGIDTGWNIVWESCTNPTSGTVTCSPDGNFTYVPSINTNMTDSFRYTISDKSGKTDTATVILRLGSGGFSNQDEDFVRINPTNTWNIIGDYLVVGNTVQCITEKIGTDAESNSFDGTCQDGSNYFNNDYMSKYIDVDDDNSTWNSSSANFTLPDTYDDSISNGVLWAGLFWQGAAHHRNSGFKQRRAEPQGAGFNYVDVTSDKSYNIVASPAKNISIKIGTGLYYPVEANRLNYDEEHGISGGYYAAFADITSIIQGQNLTKGTHTVTVANITSTEGRENGVGNYGGWSLVIIYKDDPHNEQSTPRNISIYQGFKVINGDGTDPFPGRVHEIDITDFKLPEEGAIEAKLSIFAGEGEEKYGFGVNKFDKVLLKRTATSLEKDIPGIYDASNIFDAHLAGISRDSSNNNHVVNTNGIDVDDYNVSSILETFRDEDAGINSLKIKMSSNDDYVIINMLGFSAELYIPKLCYDYAYQQNGRFFTEENDGSKEPRIKGQLFSTDPIFVSVFIKNIEVSDIIINDLKVTIDPIDTVQASYINNTVRVALPGETRKTVPVVGSSATSYIRDIEIGSVGSKDYFYTYYNIDPRRYRIDIPLNAKLSFTSTIGVVETTYEDLTLGSQIPFCVDGNFSYAPIHSIFNVEQVAAGIGRNNNTYNLFTQVVRRVENFEIAAYDINDTDIPVTVTTVVAIELIDAGAYHEIETACQEPSTALTPRVWVVFNNEKRTDFNHNTIQKAINTGSVSDQILNEASTMALAEDFFGTARRGVAFRMSYTNLGEGEELISLSPVICPGGSCYKVDNFPTLTDLDVGNGPGNCAANMDGNANTIDRIQLYCGNAVLNSQDLAVCMECIYGNNVQNICSRDNFSIRPEAFEISISDDNTSTVITDFANNTNNSGLAQLVAGYPYRFDINATNGKNIVTTTSSNPADLDENPATGYVQIFDDSDPRKRAYMEWSPSGTVDCNAPEDRDMSFSMVDGSNNNPDPINSWGDSHDTLENIGEYKFKVIDTEWTKHDWDNSLTRHQRGDYFIPSLVQQDCIKNSNNVAALETRVGCETSSVHVGFEKAPTYTELNIKSHPFAFDVSGLSIGAGPENSNNFVYINTLDKNLYPNGVDENMSYNIQGTFAATSYTEDTLPNFTSACYAKEVNMALLYNYTNGSTGNLTYDLIDYNSTNNSLIYRARENDNLNSSTGIIGQEAQYFAKDMRGSIMMDLGYNYPRTYNTPLNPKSVRINDFNISYASQPEKLHVEGKEDHQIFGNRTINQDIVFAYARAKPYKNFYDDITTNSIVNPISIVTYCDLGLNLCQDRGLANLATGMLIDSLSNESGWWYAQQHDVDSDGTVVLRTSGGGTITPASPDGIITTNGIDNTVTVTNTGGTPNIVAIDLIIKEAGVDAYTDRWVIYNKDADTVPSPLLRDRFIGDSSLSGWTGHGKTGHVVGDKINERKTRRLEW